MRSAKAKGVLEVNTEVRMIVDRFASMSLHWEAKVCVSLVSSYWRVPIKVKVYYGSV